MTANDTQQFLTQEGYDRLLAELHDLKDTKLPEALKRLKEASDQWDISENAEYDDALAARDMLEAKISEIQRLLDNVEIIKKKKWSAIDYGSQVTVAFVGDDKEYTVEIVGSGEVSIGGDIPGISFQSPIGAAIKGKKKGDTVKVRMTNGDRKDLKIIDAK